VVSRIVWRQSGRVLAERIVREHRAGKYDIDIVGTSAVTFAGMKDAGVIATYVSPEAAQLRPNMPNSQLNSSRCRSARV
jgi:ABC-type Fe3+ transport system substrate-binding protein